LAEYIIIIIIIKDIYIPQNR